ncbi:MAG TPA: TolC family protein [Terriglobales bacterium]|nr:TolC family protein [Terriglobales bacterium]
MVDALRRQRRIAGIAVFAGLVLAGLAPAQVPAALSLRQAVAEALRHSPRLRAAAANQDQAQAGVAAARAGRLPRLDLDEGFTRSNNPVAVFGTLLSQQRFTAADFALPALNQPAPLNNFQTRLTASVPLFDARQAQLRVREAKLGVNLAGSASEQARQGVLSAVISAFYRLSASQAALQVAQSATTAATAGLKMAEARYRAGLVVDSDRLSAEVYSANAQEQLVAARNDVSVASAALNRELGRPLDAPLAIAATLPTTAPSAPPAAPAALPSLVSDARRLRPELRQQQDRLAIAQSEVTRTRAAFLPVVDGFASWERDQLHFSNTGASNWTVGLSLHLNLFRGGADRAAASAAVAQKLAAQAQLDDLHAAVDLQVRQAWFAVSTAAQQLQLARSVVSQAAAALQIVQNRYNSGLATISDLLRTQTELTRARTQLVQAAYDLQVSRANRDLAVGTLTAQSPVVAHPGN